MNQLDRVARAMCVADSFDPDDESDKGPPEPPRVDFRSTVGPMRTGRVPWPNWRLYTDQAAKFIAAYEALNDGSDLAALASEVRSLDSTAERQITELRREVADLRREIDGVRALARQAR